MKKLSLKLIFAFSLLVANIVFAANNLIIESPWVADAPPSSKVRVAYMKIINPSNQAVILEKIESNSFSQVEIHQTVHEASTVKMLYHKTLTIAANSQLILKPGSYHLMLFNPKKKLNINDKVKFKIITKQQKISINAIVKKR